MNELHLILLTLGAALLASAFGRTGAAFLHVPQVSLLMLLGLAFGPLGLDVVPPQARESWYPMVSEVTLAMVGFLVGGEFSKSKLKENGRAVMAVSLLLALFSFVFVGVGSWLIGVPLATALVLGCAAIATDPAAVQSVVKETESKGPISRTLLGIVAIDDLWGLLIFSGVLAYLVGGDDGLTSGLIEAGGSLVLGAGLGLTMSLMTGRLLRGKPTTAEALGFVFISCGLAEHFELSYLLTAVTMGAVVVNTAKHHKRTFKQVEGIEWPFLVVFFVLSGATVQAEAVSTALPALTVYVVLRVAARILAGQVGTRLVGMEGRAHWIGAALLPQAGVALGLVLVVSQRLPEIGQLAQAVVILGTVGFEVVGPVLTKSLLKRADEVHEGKA